MYVHREGQLSCPGCSSASPPNDVQAEGAVHIPFQGSSMTANERGSVVSESVIIPLLWFGQFHSRLESPSGWVPFVIPCTLHVYGCNFTLNKSTTTKKNVPHSPWSKVCVCMWVGNKWNKAINSQRHLRRENSLRNFLPTWINGLLPEGKLKTDSLRGITELPFLYTERTNWTRHLVNLKALPVAKQNALNASSLASAILTRYP